jgi:nucleoside-diphosphate-sugar epimerase
VTTYDGDTSKLLSVAKCDVASTDATSLAANADALKGCSAVIYAASASKNGGSAYEVDHKGVVTVAEACLQAKVHRCVVISSTGTTRPKSLGYVFTNLGVGGNIMGEKRNGETGLMAAYNSGNPQQQQQTSSPLSYTIIRPGGLEEPKRNKVLGPSSLEISQGDVFAGIISRADVAEITVELALSNAPNVRNTAIELYYKDSVVEVEGRFKKLLADTKQQENSDNKLRLQGSTYSELLEGIRSGIDYTE